VKSLVIALVILLAARAAAADAPITYRAHATAVDFVDYPSCGAAERMLKDVHNIAFLDNGAIKVNGMLWTPVSVDIRHGLVTMSLRFHMGLVFLTLDFELDDDFADDRGLVGQYTLYGVLRRDGDGYERCADRVELRGHLTSHFNYSDTCGTGGWRCE